MENKKIYIICYCHPDWAWTHTRYWHENRYSLVLNEVLDIMKNNRDFRYYIDTYITFIEPFLRNYPEKYEELRERIKEKRIAICGTYTNLRTNMVGEETFIRDIIYGRKVFKKLFPEVELSVYAGTVDVAVGHPQIPQILNKSGYKYFRFWRPHSALSAKNIPYEFIWEGIDGSKIICSRGSYSGIGYKDIFTDKDKFLKNWEEAKKKFYQLELEYASKLSKTGIIWISHGMDDLRPLRSTNDEKLDLIEFINEWNKREKIDLVFGTPIDYFKDIERKRLPIIRGTIDPSDVCYNTSYGGSEGLWFLRILSDREITNAEKFCSIASLFGFIYPEEKFKDLWENILLFSSHATQWLFENDFNEIYNLALKTIFEIKEIKNKAINKIISQIKSEKKKIAIIFNQTNFSNYFYVKFLISSVDGMLDKSFIIKDGNGKEIPYQIINYFPNEYNTWEVEVIAKLFLPSYGYNSIYIEKGEKKTKYPSFKLTDLNKIENGNISIKFEDGYLIEIKGGDFNYKTEKDNSFGNLKLLHLDPEGILHIGKFLKEENVIWEKWYKKEEGDLRQIFECEGIIGKHRVNMDIIIYEEGRVDFELEIDWFGEENAFLLFSIPSNFFDGKIYGDIPFGFEEKNLEKEPYGRLPGRGWGNIERLIEGMFFSKSFVDYRSKEKGISLIVHNGDRYFIYDREKKTLSHITLRSFTRHKNNWEKDINEKIEAKGKHKYRYTILFHKADSLSSVIKLSEILRNEPIVIQRFPKIEKGDLPETSSFIKIKPEYVILTSFYKEGDEFILRLYETEGKEKDISIELFFKPKKVKIIDLIGNEIKDRKVLSKCNKIKLKIKKFEILTLKLSEPGSEKKDF
ncbi:MAG: glycosyl hydrolase-related protein [Candidatus Omnitrophica bacterium]|nr:glycosyl hydrolase-related protein [Candidatus Omnitrophota bacterium]